MDDVPGQVLYCDKCELNINCSDDKHSGNIFLYLSVKKQLENFCNHHRQDLSFSNNRRKMCSYALEDILDGHLYKHKFSDEVLSDMISINFSIDGTPLFKSSSTSITPIVYIINEIYHQKRQQYVMLASLYLGSEKPVMNEYLKPFVNEAKLLLTEGFHYNYNGSYFHKKCRVLMGVCDSIKRPELQRSKMFRGAYGCGLCKYHDEEIPKDNGHVRVYPITDDGNAYGEGLRSHAETLTGCIVCHSAFTGDFLNYSLIRDITKKIFIWELKLMKLIN